MVLLASTYDQSRFFKAADLTQEKKLRIKQVTEESVGTGRDKEQKLVVWFTNDEHGLVLKKGNNRTIRSRQRLGWKDHRPVPNPGRIPRQDGARHAGAHPAAEASHRSAGAADRAAAMGGMEMDEAGQ
jgi:hypothetical protein